MNAFARKLIVLILSEIGALENERTRKEFSAFAEAKHVKDMFTKNHANVATQKKVYKRIAEFQEMKAQTTDAKRIKDLVKFSRTTLTILKDSGVIIEQAYLNMLRDWKNYVPLHRVFDDNEDIRFGDSLKKMKGSSLDKIDPLQTIIRNTYDYIRRVEKNETKLMLTKMARTSGFGMLVEEVDGKTLIYIASVAFSHQWILHVASRIVLIMITSLPLQMQTYHAGINSSVHLIRVTSSGKRVITIRREHHKLYKIYRRNGKYLI